MCAIWLNVHTCYLDVSLPELSSGNLIEFVQADFFPPPSMYKSDNCKCFLVAKALWELPGGHCSVWEIGCVVVQELTGLSAKA